MNDKEAFLAQQEAELKLWNDELKHLESQARHVQPAAQRGCQQLLAFLGKMRLQAQDQLNTLNDARDDAWTEIKRSLEGLWQDLHEGRDWRPGTSGAWTAIPRRRCMIRTWFRKSPSEPKAALRKGGGSSFRSAFRI